jgi:hypothetical protein
MGYNQRNDEIRDNVERMRREREAYADALATIEQFNARLAAKKSAWFWPTIAAAHFKTSLVGHRLRQLRHGD